MRENVRARIQWLFHASKTSENEKVGTGDYCCVPSCSSSFYKRVDGKYEKTGISFFKFPSDEKLKKLWITILSQYRRKSATDLFDPTLLKIS